MLAGHPDDPTYLAATREAFALMQSASVEEEFRPGEKVHRRGNFPALAVGISYGNGQTEPTELSEGVKGKGLHANLLQKLVGHEAVSRMAAFSSGESIHCVFSDRRLIHREITAAFALWAPRVYGYYQTRLKIMYQALPHLKPNFPRSIFVCSTFNFGPQVCTFKHRDVLNCPFGWCGIHALENFDHKKGGHIILWEPKVVIEFPSGSSILVPSATVAHSNIPIAHDEQRASFTQYCAGGIFRWVDNGCRLESKLAEEDPVEYRRICGLKRDRYKMGLSLFSTLDELLTTVDSTVTPSVD